MTYEKRKELLENKVMKRFDLVKGYVEVRNYKDIVEGCTLNVDLARGGINVELIKSFGTKEEALEELKNYKTSIYSFSTAVGTMWEVTEYFVEAGEYDEDGDLTGCVDVLDYSEMPVDKEGCFNKIKCENKTKAIVHMNYVFSGDVCVDIPTDLLKGKDAYKAAYEYIQDNINKIPVAENTEYIPNSDFFSKEDIELCETEFRCSDCACLTEREGEWYCDERQEYCNEIISCPESNF